MLPKPLNKRGFTIIELLLVMGVLAVLFGFIIFNILGTQRRASIDSSVDQLVSDIKQQQLKSMAGESTLGNGLYGVHFAANQYSLFQGSIFSSASSGNFNVPADGVLTFTTTFPNSDLIFATASGEVVNFSGTQNTITLSDSQGQQKTLTLNSYGTIISIN